MILPQELTDRIMASNAVADEDQLPLHQESYTSAAFDGARIACTTASVLVELDSTLTEPERMILADALMQARRILDAAREVIRIEPTSVHVVRSNESRIIIPGA